MLLIAIQLQYHIMERDHQYAYDIDGEWVNAKKTSYKKYQTFFCECPEKHKMKLVKPSGLSGKRPFCDYFAHVQTGYKRQKIDEKVSCSPGGESIQHRLAKHKLRESVGLYYFPVFRCQSCLHENMIDSVGCSVSMEVVSRDKKWRYDCLLCKEGLPVAALEVVHMHLTSTFKAESVRGGGLEIAEFRVDEVLSMTDKGRNKLDNLKIRIGRCQDCVLKDSYIWARDCWVDELFELINQENAVTKNYALAEKKKLEIGYRLQYLVMESKRWIHQCFLEEIEELQRQYSVVFQGMTREYNLRVILKKSNIVDKCKDLLELSLFRLQVEVSFYGKLTFRKAERWSGGLLVNGFNKTLPTKNICIYLIHDINLVCRRQWKKSDVQIEFHVFLHCSTIIRYFSSLNESLVELKDCRWPILKDIERNHGICANCQNEFRGHTSDNCRHKFCRRCGRNGHLFSQCYAHRDILNRVLPNPYTGMMQARH